MMKDIRNTPNLRTNVDFITKVYVYGKGKYRMEGMGFPSNPLQFKTSNSHMKELTKEQKETYRKWLANGDLNNIAKSIGEEYATRAAVYIGRKYTDSLQK